MANSKQLWFQYFVIPQVFEPLEDSLHRQCSLGSSLIYFIFYFNFPFLGQK